VRCFVPKLTEPTGKLIKGAHVKTEGGLLHRNNQKEVTVGKNAGPADIPSPEVYARVPRTLDHCTTPGESEVTEGAARIEQLQGCSVLSTELLPFHRAKALLCPRARFSSTLTVAQYFRDTWPMVLRNTSDCPGLLMALFNGEV